MKKDFVLGIVALIVIIICGVLYYNFSVRDEPVAEVFVQDTDTAYIQNTDDNLTTIKIYITGEVVSPGVYELETDSRLQDALILAGGETENADLSIINLARFITDGEHIIIPAYGDMPPETEHSDIINVNSATKSELMTLPFIGDALAESIINYRNKNGKFTEKEQIKNVPKIGDKIYESIKDSITVK